MEKLCPVCHQPIQDNYFFCPNCGKNVKEGLEPVTLASQIKVYMISIFLPPLGFWPGVKYLLQENKAAKKIGMIAIILTILSTIVTIYLTFQISNSVNSQVQKQLQQYNGYY